MMSRQRLVEHLYAKLPDFHRISRPKLLRWFSALIVGAFLLAYVPSPFNRNLYPKTLSTRIRVPENLETKILTRFDDLLRQGKIFYERTESELYTVNGFEFEFRITPIFKKKPVLRPDAPGRSKAGGPFINPDPDEIVTELGTKHRLLVNKYCIYRPMLVLPTTEYALQTDDLDVSDLEAAWVVLKAFSTPSVIIYNCGVNAGSSQGHKHLQIFPLPAHQLWPAKANSFDDIATRLENVPFKHFVLRLSKHANPEQVYAACHRLLSLSHVALAESGSDSKDYNVVLTAEWIAVIPRRTAGPKGPFGANAAGMLGMVTVPDRQEREWWAELGYTKYLEQLGVPFESGALQP